MKRIISLLLTFIMSLLILLPCFADDADGEIPPGAVPVDDYIMVCLKHEYSFPETEHGPEYYNAEYVEKVEVIWDYNPGSLQDRETFCLVELLWLTDKGKAHFDEFLNELNAREDVLAAERDYSCRAFDPLEIPASGDVDGDGAVNAKDARLALRASAELEQLNDTAFLAADINRDSRITADEARVILRVGAKLEVMHSAGYYYDSSLSNLVWTDVCCGWYYSPDDNALYADSLNRAGRNQLPLYKFDSKSELDDFQRKFGDDLSTIYDDLRSEGAAKMQKYDAAWFEDNSLLLVYVEASSGSYRYGLESVGSESDKLILYITQTDHPEVSTCDMSGWFILVELPHSVAERFSEFDAMRK